MTSAEALYSEASANKHFEHYPCEKTPILAILDTKSHRIITAIKTVTTSVDTSVYFLYDIERAKKKNVL